MSTHRTPSLPQVSWIQSVEDVEVVIDGIGAHYRGIFVCHFGCRGLCVKMGSNMICSVMHYENKYVCTIMYI